MLGSLGSVPQKEVWDEANQVYLYTPGDQSVLILLYGVATVLLTALMVWAWRGALKSAFQAECLDKAGAYVNTFADDLKSLLHENLHRLLMTPPMIFILALTILPLIFMICMAFTNYSRIDNHLMLFDCIVPCCGGGVSRLYGGVWRRISRYAWVAWQRSAERGVG